MQEVIKLVTDNYEARDLGDITYALGSKDSTRRIGQPAIEPEGVHRINAIEVWIRRMPTRSNSTWARIEDVKRRQP